MTDTITPNGQNKNRQARANRANSKLSTGPKTEAGKAHSAQNATTHGLTARAIVLPTEDPAAFQLHTQQLLDEYQPKTPTETQLVKVLAGAYWHLNRIDHIENALFSQDSGAPDLTTQFRSLAILSMHRHRLSRQIELTRKELRELQRGRRYDEEKQLEKAADLLEMDKEKGVPFNPAEDGFVFSTTEIETYIRRRDRAEEAKDAMIERKYRRENPDEDDEDEEE